MEEQSLFRNTFNKDLIAAMAKNIAASYDQFDSIKFKNLANNGLEQLALKERNHQITQALINCLPNDFSLACEIIVKSIQHNPFPYRGNWDSFYYMPFGTYVALKGCSSMHLAQSFEALEEITIRFTSEFAIRPFINKFPEESLLQLNKWKNHPDENVRRLCSEGSRPRLPWAEKIQAHINDPAPCFEILKDLMEDESLYVKKSVANHLNDISKDNADLLLNFISDYTNSINKNTNWICKHALRTLIKKGNKKALQLLGYNEHPNIIVSELKLATNKVQLNNYLSFEFSITNQETECQQLMIDYVVYHLKANKQLLPKVFKLKTITLKSNETITIKKKHSFKVITTRKYYVGEHKIAVQINGTIFSQESFLLCDSN